MKNKAVYAWQKTKQTIVATLPLVVGILLLISCLSLLLKSSLLVVLFKNNIFSDSFIGAIIGSLAAGNPITSYVLAGEFMEINISLAAVTAFIIAWVTVGFIQFPAEAMMLGKKFALIRNILSFLSAILIGLITQLVLG